MTKIEYCGICGKAIQGIVINCSYCMIPLCRKHRTNNLCPAHVHTMTKQQSKKLTREHHYSIWMIICALWIVGPTFLITIFIFIWGEKKYNGAIALGVTILEILVFWLILRRSYKKSREIKSEALEYKEQMTKTCPNCNNVIPKEQVICSYCNFDTSQDYDQLMRQATIAGINAGLQELVDVHKGTPEEIEDFYDGVRDSAQQVCPHCNRRIESSLPSKNCPYCLKQI